MLLHSHIEPETLRAAEGFAGHGADHELDFRVGGKEIAREFGADGSVLTFESLYHDIVADQRIVCASVLYFGETPATVSLTTVELLTEQSAFLDGHEQPAWREQGIIGQLAALDAELRRP
jgi:uncharacterized protein YndB with AHSA1/START domain